MGATTLYHPVPLSVLRGATAYCGWKIGKIEQITSDFATTTAKYKLEIVDMPKNLSIYGAQIVAKQFQHCFAADITVNRVWQSKNGIWYAEIEACAGMTQESLIETDHVSHDFPF